MTPRRVWHRLYGDFLMPSRLAAYRELLETALAAGYEIVSVATAWDRIRAGEAPGGGRTLILRHDIDSGPGTAAAMWRIERELGVAGSWYFRLSTLDPGLMAAIAAAGAEASYHYEELATVAKRHRARTAAAARALVPEAQARFAANLRALRERTGLACRTVASHGDFVNRAVGVMNWAILEDPALRDELGIALETYDAAFMDHVTSRHADTTYPTFWTTGSPLPAIARGEPVVYLLVHPGAWQTEPRRAVVNDLRRLIEGFAYDPPSPRSGPSRSGAS